MSFFSSHSNTERIGAIVDIGSGSVLVAIIASKPGQPLPEIIWSHREHAPLRTINAVEESAKSVMTALMNTLLKLDSEGRQALHQVKPRQKITEVQYTISAPWAYTVTKTVTYTQSEPFTVTANLLEELVRAARQKITVELETDDASHQLGLTIVARGTLDTSANGYRVRNPIGEKATDLVLSEASVVTQTYLDNHLKELQQKLFPRASSQKLSAMLALYCVAKDVTTELTEACIVNITYEATEIGIIREGVLQYVTHTPFGAFSLAREIASITEVPLYEAFQSLHTETPLEFLNNLSASKRSDVEQVFEAYTNRVESLFHETGDELSIPKRIVIHADLRSEPLFVSFISGAAKRCLKSDAHVSMLTSEIVKRYESQAQAAVAQAIQSDTAMLASAQYFHTTTHCHDFEYL